MKKMKRFLSLILTFSILFILIPTQAIAQNEADIGYNIPNTLLSEAQVTPSPVATQASMLDLEPADVTLVNSPSGNTYNTRVSYEILTKGKSGNIVADTQSVVVRFILKNPSEQPVSFNYSVLSGSAEEKHLIGTTSGMVILSQEEPVMDVTIEIAPFADKPGGDYSLPNDPNTFWTGEHFFYLYCSDIQNALFDGSQKSLTVPVPVESQFDYGAAYENAVNTKLIDFDDVAGGSNGVYSVTESGELRFTADISGDIRKMIDDGVFSHIQLPQGYFINESVEAQDILYQIKAKNDIPFREAFITKSQNINLETNSQTSFYSDVFGQSIPIEEINLGSWTESNGIFNKLDFIFDYTNVVTPGAIFISFSDEAGQYLQHQVSFSDQVPPKVTQVSTDMLQAGYGDEIPVTIEFNEPIYTDSITFSVDGQTMSPMEGAGTISKKVSFLYRIGDGALDAESFTVHVSDIFGAVDLSGKAMEDSVSGSTLVDISFDPMLSFAYCAVPSVNLDQGASRNMSATVSIPLKQDTKLSNWLLDESRLSGGNISTVVKARAITADGTTDIPLTVHTDITRVTGLTGSFTAPENNTGENAFYGLEIYMDTGSGYKLIESLVTTYAVQPLILVDDESDITLDYTHWPPGNQILLNAESSLALGYFLNVDATWVGPDYFSWSSSDESIATIENNGKIILMGTGQVYFTLTVTNPMTEDAVIINSSTLSVLDSQDVYLYVPNGIKNQEILIGSDAKISFTSNLVDRNDLYGGSGTETRYTFTLYEVVYDDGPMKKGSILSTEELKTTAQATLNSYTVPGRLLTKVTEKGQYGYILEISAKDLQSGSTMTAEANIRIRQMPAKASLIRPESVFLLDSDDGFSVEFDIENRTFDTQYSLTVIKNSAATPIRSVEFPAPIGPVNISLSMVDSSRLLDIYTVSLKAKNLSDEAWSYDSYSIYVYNTSAMNMVLDGFPAPGSLTMGYDFKGEEILYNIDFLKYRSMIGKELIRTVQINDKSYAWSAIADRVTWKVDGESVSLWYDNRRIGEDYNPVLLPGTALMLHGDGSGSSVVTATHTLTGMTDSMDVTLKPLNDKLYLFRVYPEASCEMVYTNGKGQEKTISFSGEVGVYEESGITSDIVFYPKDGAENVYDFSVLPHKTLVANQNGGSSFDLYPINTVKLPLINYNVTLELFDEITGEPYTDDIIIRGGVYLNDLYQAVTTINGKLGNGDQKINADEKGRYSLAFRPADFTNKFLSSDKLRYVIEVSFADHSHLPQYIIIENSAIQAQKNSPLGVCVSEEIKTLDASSIQNSAVVLSQSVTLDEEVKPITKRFCLEEVPKSAILDMTVMVPHYSKDYYRLILLDTSRGLMTESPIGEFVQNYPFSDMVTLHFTFDFIETIRLALNTTKPGEVAYYSPIIRSYDGSWELKLSNHFEVQNLKNIPNMSDSLDKGGDLSEIYYSLLSMSYSTKKISFSDKAEAVKDALDILDGYSLNTTSLGLEVQSTEDPLVYKGIIRFAAGSYKDSNPSGVFLGGEETMSYNFMPGAIEAYRMAKGTFLKKAKEEMNKNFHKTYGGGAYIDCEIYYSIEEAKWKIRLLYGDFYLGGGGNYRRSYNGWVAFVPITATFQFSLTAETGLTILHSRANNTTAYIPRLRPVFGIYGFGGVGFDYDITALKAGGYGLVTHEQEYLWYTDDEGLKMDGQQLTISGEVGVKFKIRLFFVNLGGKYVLADYSKSWDFNEYKEIQDKIAKNKKERSPKEFLAPGEFLRSGDTSMLTLVPVEESVTFEDRSYLDAYERYWGTPGSGIRMFALFSDEEWKDVWVNAYPHAAPQISDDGELMVYLSDMGSEDLSDTAVLFTVKDETGSFFVEGKEISLSDYPDTSPYLSGTKDGAFVVWVRSFTNMSDEAGSDATMEDVINGLSSSEVMAGRYKDGEFISTRLTNNDNPDLAPVTAASGNRAIAVWRSVTLGDMDNPLDFTSDYIMYSMFDGSNWREVKCLYDGTIDRIQALNSAMLSDGTSAIVYQIAEGDKDSEINCAVLDTDGEVVRTLRLTDNMTGDVNPQITTAEFHDGVQRFVIGWNAQNESVDSTVQMVAVNAEGTIYPEFSLELSDSTGATDYSNFLFTRGADKLEDLSLIWNQPEDGNKDGTYEYNIFGTKLLVSADNTVSTSGKQKLLALSESRTLDNIEARVDPDTGKVHFVILLTEINGASTLATAVAEYKNDFTVKEPDYEYRDLLPGLDMPVKFTLKNDGIDTITHIAIELGGQTFEYEDENIASGDTKTYLVSYSVPETLTDTNFSISAQFGETGDTCNHSGILKLSLPDVGIYQINSTKETRRERGFRVLLQNTAFADLKKKTHTVKLEVWNHSDYTAGSPLKTFTVSENDFDILNNSLLSVDVILSEDDLVRLLNESGELPDGGVSLLFRVVLTEEGSAIEDADISNDMDYINLYSLIEKNDSTVSLASLSETVVGKTTVQVEAFNNSMQTIKNGNIIVTLRDKSGNVLETKQTYSSSDSASLLSIPGEESKTAIIQFNHTGYQADVTFDRVSGESSQLSVLKLAGIPMEFKPNVFEYNLMTYGLNQTILTAVAENPESAIKVTKNGVPLSIVNPIAMPYGTTVFVITVTAGGTNTTYKVKVENNRLDDSTNPGNNDPVIPNKPDSSKSDSFLAELTIDGIKQWNLSVIIRGGRAVVSLGTLAQKLFSRDTNVVLNIPLIPGVEGYTLEMPASTLAGKYTGAAITVSTELGSIQIPAGMLKGMKDLEEKTAGITIDTSDKSKLPEDIKVTVGNRPIVSLTLTLDGEQIPWNNPDVQVKVSIPYTPTAKEKKNLQNIVIWYIDGSGHAVLVPNGRYNPMTGTVTFATTHMYFKDVVAVDINEGRLTIDVNRIPEELIEENEEDIILTIPSKEFVEYIAKEEVIDANIRVIDEAIHSGESSKRKNLLLKADILEAAKDSEKDLSISVEDKEGRERFTWYFPSNELTSSQKDINDVNLYLEVNETEFTEDSTATSEVHDKGLIIDFHHEGELPSQAGVKIYVGDKKDMKPGSRVYLYHINQVTGLLETLPFSSNYKVDDEGYIYINILHCSDYAVFTRKASSDLISSLRNQISVTTDKKILYAGGYVDASAQITVTLPPTLETVESFKKETSQSAIGGVTVTYRSSNEKVASVDQEGKITAKKKGNTIIYVTVKLYSGKTKVVILKVNVKEPYIQLTKYIDTMEFDSIYRFRAEAYGLDIKDLVWTTKRKSTVVINKNTGLAIAKSKGTDYVTATIHNVSKEIKVVVK